MDDSWFERLVAVIEADGRDMKALSREAGCGQNYVQQMIKNGKQPTVGRFVSLLAVLGRPASLHVILGADLSAEDEELIRLVSGLPDERKRKALAFFRELQAP